MPSGYERSDTVSASVEHTVSRMTHLASYCSIQPRGSGRVSGFLQIAQTLRRHRSSIVRWRSTRHVWEMCCQSKEEEAREATSAAARVLISACSAEGLRIQHRPSIG